MRPEDKATVLQKVTERVLQTRIGQGQLSGPALDVLINDTIYHERKRLEKEPFSKQVREQRRFWKKVNRELLAMDEEEKLQLLQTVIERFVREIMGHFNQRVYNFATRALPVLFGIMLNTFSPRVFFSKFPHLPKPKDSIIVQGEIALMQSLQCKGTLLFVPTHSSNLDSIVAGWSLYNMGLPPYTYGAGINLFTNFLLSFFMHNLGAYKIDRKKTARLYKDVLKEYAAVSLELGYDGIFFPGGTRSRSGAIERKLKLGLLGTGLQAYINNLKNRVAQPNLYVVPCTLTYQLVLEAENLIDDYLQRTGKSRYIITDDEFSRPRRVFNFISSIFSLNSRIYVTICPALDIFGNRVDAAGISYDQRGRPIDISRYVLVDGAYEHLPQRDQEYIKDLGEEIVRLYSCNNVAMSTHIVAFVLFSLFRRRYPDVDIYRFLRTIKEDQLSVGEFYEGMEKFMGVLKQAVTRGDLLLDPKLHKVSVDSVIRHALQLFKTYHTNHVIIRKQDKIIAHDPNLVFFYRNRLSGYGLEKGLQAPEEMV